MLRIKSLFSFHKNAKIAKEQKSLFEEVYLELTKKMSVSTDFGDVLIDFQLPADWQRLKGHSVGEINFRDFYSRDNIASAHNLWAKDAVVFGHHHSNATEYIYLVHGLLEITMDNKKTTIHPDTDNPHIIPMAKRHSIRAIENSVFVTKFVIQKI